jgi:hypothetical protein
MAQLPKPRLGTISYADLLALIGALTSPPSELQYWLWYMHQQNTVRLYGAGVLTRVKSMLCFIIACD